MFGTSRRTLVWSDQSPVRAKIIWEIIDLFLYFLQVGENLWFWDQTSWFLQKGVLQALRSN